MGLFLRCLFCPILLFIFLLIYIVFFVVVFFFLRSLCLYWLNRLLKRDKVEEWVAPIPVAAVLHSLVGNGELPQIVANHLGLGFLLFEGLAIVDTHHAAHHLRQDNRVPQVHLNHLGLFHQGSLLLGLAQALQQQVLFPPQTPVEPLLLPSTVQLHQLLLGHVQQLVEVHATVGELAEGALLLLHFCHIISSLEGTT